MELVTGWSNGKLDIRNIKNGEVLFKDNFPESLAGVSTVEVMKTGTTHLIACDILGERKLLYEIMQMVYKPMYEFSWLEE